MTSTASAARPLVPALVAIAAAEAATLAAHAAGFDVRGFTWLIAALVAGASLSGSV
ncbi:hypothetical protein [Thermostaphylospora chromogena]|uniref:Uncharacterized protein n=1 Tax=Thermostaphylospora chromogena TaxID=35622 RepID=A0A1H1FUL6_9ACTN|nr:hypothetical protein [Thermostaphylospora chromogena]SDR04702.1 hypothetical protein SAMN04489764_3196 [Thermostaphylospora chromogena]